MAEKKISELTSLTGANAATGDLIPIVDVDATETKKITRAEFFTNTPNINGRDIAADGSKLDGIEANADVTDATNVEAAGAVMESDTTTASMSFVIDEDTMVSDLDTKVPTQQSVKAYVDGRVASSVNYAGSYDAATNTPDLDSSPSGISVGDMYTVTVAGTFFTIGVEVGDVLIAEVNNASVEADWTIVNKNLDAASIKSSYESNPDTNAFTDAEQSKLSGIEAGADVTDTANVTAAGALMDSEVTNLAAVKAFDPTDYATAAQGSLADTATQPGDNVSTLNNDAGYVTSLSDLSITATATEINYVDGVTSAIQTQLDGKVDQTSATGSAEIPSGTEAQRDGAPSAGYFRFNTETSQFEGYNGTNWGSVGGGANGRNLIINGSGRINQRGYTSGTATSGANEYTLDRWRVVTSGQNLSFTGTDAGRVMTAPAGGAEQVIEGVNIAGGTYVLNWTGTATATVDGNAVSKGGTFTLTANTNATVRFTGGTFSEVQLEAGSASTPFEFRSYGQELALCERYYQDGIYLVRGAATTSGGRWNQSIPLRTHPRTAPSVSFNVLEASGAFSGANPAVEVWGSATLRTTTDPLSSASTSDNILQLTWVADAEL